MGDLEHGAPSTTAWRGRFARFASLTALFGLAAATLVAVGVASPAEARTASGGAGRFGSSINWVEWGTIGQRLPATGFTGTTVQSVGGVDVTVTCVASNITQATVGDVLTATRPGSWQGDVLDDLYNIGGTGTSNQMVASINGGGANFRADFDVSCTAATDDGTDVPLAGLVFADAEQSLPNEYVAAQPLMEATWRIIDRYRTPGCTASSTATRDSNNRIELRGTAPLCAAGPGAVAFLDGATRMRATVASQGGGSSIAIGVVLAADHGDAPASYDNVGHLASFSFSGGEIPQNTPTRVNDPTFALGNTTAPPYRLGANLDPESGNPSTNATSDDLSGGGAYGPANDEDGFSGSRSLSGAVGDAYSAPASCNPAGASIAGWIDWNIDGDFDDPGERSQTATCAGGAATLNWTIPDSVIGKTSGAMTFMRLRLAQNASQLAQPFGLATSGEAEDYAMTLDLSPTIEVTKNISGRARSDDQFRVDIANGGTTVSSATTTGTNTSASTGRVIVNPGTPHTISEMIASGLSTFSDYANPTIVCADPDSGDRIATSGSAPSWSIPGLTPTGRASCTITNVGNAPDIAVVKTANGLVDLDDNGADAGDRIPYSFVVTNTGNTSLSNITLSETAFTGSGDAPQPTCPASLTLASGESLTCTATYTLTQDDVNAGTVSNTATATGTPPGTLPPVISSPSTATSEITRFAALTMVKTGQPNGDPQTGAVIDYSFVMTNTGNVTLTNITVSETTFTGAGTAPAVTCPAGAVSLAPGEQVICTAAYTVTQADVDNGGFTNTATATGTSPTGVSDPAPAESSSAIPAEQNAALTLEKTVTPSTADTAGQQVSYEFVLTNTGNITLTNTAVEENTFDGSGVPSDITCTGNGSLLPGQQRTCSSSYTVTEADIAQGTVTNTATATSTGPAGPVNSSPDDATLTLSAAPALTLSKTVSPTSATRAGDEATFSYVITNTGNITLADVTVNEERFTGTGAPSALVCPPGATSLAPEATVTCTSTYELTQADVDRGDVENTAVATGTPPGTLTAPVSAPSSAAITIDATPALTLTKTVTPETAAAAGTLATYSFAVTNTGNVTIVGASISEQEFTGTGMLAAVDCPSGIASLAPGDTETCTAAYTISQDDVDRGTVINTAIARGTDPAEQSVQSDPSSTTLTLTQTPTLGLNKTVAPTVVDQAGQTVNYSFEVTNTGNTTLTDVAPTETAFDGLGSISAIDCPDTLDTLAPSASGICTATYTVTQADIDAGTVTNTATATSQSPTGTTINANPNDAVFTATAVTGITLDKTVNPSAVEKAGDQVTYSFEVINTGNSSLRDITVTETEFTGTGPAPQITCPTGAVQPGTAVTCAAIYTLTQADIDRGSVENTATATGTPPGDLPAPVSAPSDATVTVTPTPSLMLVKSASPNTEEDFAVGTDVTYSFVTTNDGNVTIADPVINEGTFTGTGNLSDVDCPATASLAPAEQLICTASYTITQGDVDAGFVANTATATGTPPNGPPIESPQSRVQLPQPQDPGITVQKTANRTTFSAVGDEIEYSFKITNIGNVTLTDPEIDETRFTGTGGLSDVTCPPAAASLNPGASVTCTATYQATQADLDAGAVENTATATATARTAPAPVSAPSTASVDAVGVGTIALTKIANVIESNGDDTNNTGDRIAWTITVANTGTITLTDVTVSDPTAGPVTCPTTTLAPGVSIDCAVPNHTITSADTRAGSVSNTATVTATGLQGATVTTDPATATVPTEQTDTTVVPRNDDERLAFTGATLPYGIAVAGTLLVAGLVLMTMRRRRTVGG